MNPATLLTFAPPRYSPSVPRQIYEGYRSYACFCIEWTSVFASDASRVMRVPIASHKVA